MENKKRKLVGILLLAGMAVCLLPIGQAYCRSVRHRVQQEVLNEMVSEAAVQYPVQADRGKQYSDKKIYKGTKA